MGANRAERTDNAIAVETRNASDAPSGSPQKSPSQMSETLIRNLHNFLGKQIRLNVGFQSPVLHVKPGSADNTLRVVACLSTRFTLNLRLMIIYLGKGRSPFIPRREPLARSQAEALR